jgi:arabinogalactan endo-1,4-beta-galactosidase
MLFSMTINALRYFKYIPCFLMLFLVFTCKKSSSPTPVTPANSRVYYPASKFVMGADLSYVNQIEDHAAVYKDSATIKDPFRIFKNHGANTVRVRLWNNPQWMAAYNNGSLYSNMTDVEKTIGRAKALGMQVNLDLHYSDTWADPGNQQTPAAWDGLSLAVLKDSVYQYTLNVLNELQSKSLVPEMIQIGNETNQGMLFPIGKVVGNDWTAFGILLNAGIKAVRDFSMNASIKPQIILHVAGPENGDWWTGNITTLAAVTDFDIIGISNYYVWSSLKTMSTLGTTLSGLKAKYGKKVMLVETAYPWTSDYADSYTNIISGSSQFGTYTVSKQGQYDYMKDLTQTVISAGGAGIMYWEPAYISSGIRDPWGTGSSWENNTFFDFSGNTLPGIDFMNFAYQF